MSTFTRAELRALPAADLADLIKMAEPDPARTWGDPFWDRAIAIGLDPTNPNDRRVVEAAASVAGDVPESFSAPIGAGQDGVRSDLTPNEPAPTAPTDGDQDADDDGLGVPEADPAGAAELRAAMEMSAVNGRPFMAGTFAMYADPSGAVVLVTEDAGMNVRRTVIPRKVVRIALQFMAGDVGPIGRLFGRRLGRG